ncbi:MAG: CRISPR-associated endoribonuclease Cas6 [Anaerolineaceae bacterium]|nr:CRISPR-associated endoribonuclease Cas6 [Anaerolineaceae bacterium]
MTVTQPYDYGALVVRLRATDETVDALKRKQGRISAFMGNAVHQALHGSISTDAAAELHDPAISAQPFATSTLFRWRLDMPLQGRITAGDMGWVRFVGLHPYVMRELEAFRQTYPRTIEIDRVPWKVMGCNWHSHLYAGRCDAAYCQHYHHDLAPPRLIRLRFLTPTYFKSRGIEPYLTPEPRLVFAEGLLRRWESFYPQSPPPPGYAKFVERHVHLHSQTGYMTTTVMLKGAVMRGFTSDAIYTIEPPPQPDLDFPACARFLAVMAEYATYAGVGKKTTMGLGMVDRVRIVRLNRPHTVMLYPGLNRILA